MPTSYAQKQSVAQKKEVSSAASVLDSSSQGESLQRRANMANNAAQCASLPPRPNNTGMPDNLKAGIESLSGFSMDDVRVHYNSSKPATVQALAYTQGTDIHVAPGQEKCLPHEAWHVAQQMAGRVSPTTNINGMPVNDNAALEHEADVMGEKAVSQRKKCSAENECGVVNLVAQRVVQMAGHSDTFLTPPENAPYLLKIVGQNEYDEYCHIADNQNSQGESQAEIQQRDTYRAVYPLVYGLFFDKQSRWGNAEIPDTPENNTKAQNKYVVAIQKLNKFGGVVGHRAHIFDFKIGKKTASKKELHYGAGMSTSAATWKKFRMTMADLCTLSIPRGVRDSDNTGDIKKIRRVLGRLDPTERARLMVGFEEQFNNLYNYIETAETLYIASSILVGQEGNRLVVKLIDLAHPIRKRPENDGQVNDGHYYEGDKFEKIRSGMLLGIRNLRTLICTNNFLAWSL